MSKTKIYCFLLVLFATAANAQTETKVLGWNKNANLGFNMSLSSSQDVVGQSDGTTQNYGLNLKGGYNRIGENDEWRNDFSLLESTTKSPGVPQFIKSGD